MDTGGNYMIIIKMRERQICPTEGEGKVRGRSPWLEKKMELERKNYAGITEMFYSPHSCNYMMS